MVAMNFDMVVSAVKTLIDGLGENVARDGLTNTPQRVATICESFSAAKKISDEELLSRTFAAENYDDFVIVKNIGFSSFCEHHLLPFFGKVSVAYIPKNGIVVGLSKLVRVVDKYSKRLQLQERLTRQIMNAIAENVANDGVFVMVSAQHMCMTTRGVVQPGSETITRARCGKFSSDTAIVRDAQQLILGTNG
jgi:GTP cyclohydrolase I